MSIADSPEMPLQCDVSYHSHRAEYLQKTAMLVWDEAPMANKTWLYAVNSL